MSITSAVAKQEETRPPTVGQMIQDLRPELQRALPKGMDADRLARVALTLVRKDKNLARCNPYSFAGALLTAAQLGLEPGVDDEAYLVPYGDECQLIIGYKGFAKLFYQHPLAKELAARAVHENDDFDYAYGTNPYLRHKPATGDRGKVTHYYAVASLTTGATPFTVITAAEAKELRGGKVGPSGKIADPMHWMERKTAVRQLVKMLPKSATLARALDADDRMGSELRAEAEPSKALDGATTPPPPALESADVHADPDTGEVIDAELVTGDEVDGWPPVREPGTGTA